VKSLGGVKRYARSVGFVIALSIVVALAIHYRGALASAAALVLSASWSVLPAFALFLIWNHVATIGWRDLAVATSDGTTTTPSIWRLSRLRLEAQAINLLLPLAGEVTRAARMADRPGRISVALDLIATTVAEAAFAVSALLLHPHFRPHQTPALVLLLVCAAAIVAAWGFLPALGAPLAARFPLLSPLRREFQPAFRRAVGWHLLECVLGVGEIWIFAVSLHVPLDAASVYFAAAAVRAMGTLGFFIPGQLGAVDGSLVWALGALGHPVASGLAIALARRARQLLVGTVGALLVFADVRRRPRPNLQLVEGHEPRRAL
jgi:hypothetical protein